MELFAYKSHNLDVVHKMDCQPCQKDYRLHSHTTFQICYLLDGGCTYHVEGSSYPMEPGDLVITSPQEVHYIEIDPKKPCERISLNFGTSFFQAIDPDGILHIPFLNRETGKNNLYRSAELPQVHFKSYFRNMIASESDRCNILIQLLMLLREVSAVFDLASYRDDASDSLENRVIRYICNNLRRDLTLDSLSEKFFVSKPTLYRRFKRATGTSVAKYVHTKRMLCARQMILDNERLADICTGCGFKDYSTFYRAYIRYFGHSPKAENKAEP